MMFLTLISLLDSSSDVNILTENQSAPGGLPCGTSSFYKRYGIIFNFPYDDQFYTFNMLSFANQAAGGSTIGPFTFAGTTNKTRFGIRTYFVAKVKTHILEVKHFKPQEKKSSHRGSGGGGSAHVRAFIDRETFESHPNYVLGQSYDVTVGAEGQRGVGNQNPQGVFTSI